MLMQRSDREPVVDLGARLLNLLLFSVGDGVLVSRVCLRDQVVFTTLVLHDSWKRLLLPDVQLHTEVLGHKEILPAAEPCGAQVNQIFLRQRLGMRLALVNDVADRQLYLDQVAERIGLLIHS